MNQQDPLKVAVLGAGTVGADVLRLISEQGDDLTQRIGAPLKVTGVAVRDISKDRGPHIDPALITDDPSSVIADADIVVELMGGIEPARTQILEALRSGASVVTANKALVASHGAELHQAADEAEQDLVYEAAVAAAIPIVRPIRESLAGDRVQRVLGIVNGTTNYMLDAMTRQGVDFEDILATAQRLGYAEADPTADVGGHDAAAKAAILASLAFHTRVTLDDVHCEGITSVTSADIAAAARMNRVVKLLAVAERLEHQGREAISVRVYPVMIPKDHPLATVYEAYNAIFIEADAAGDLMFYGQGAGGAPTASAVLGDVVSVARHRVHKSAGPRDSSYADLPIIPVEELSSRVHLSLTVIDKPGVLASVAGILSDHQISISTIHQQLVDGDSNSEQVGRATLSIATHTATEASLARARAALEAHEAVVSVDSVIRIEGN